MYSECSTCKSKIDNYSQKYATDTITYQQWQNNDKIEKIDINSTVKDAFEKLKSLLKEFLIHTVFPRLERARSINFRLAPRGVVFEGAR